MYTRLSVTKLKNMIDDDKDNILIDVNSFLSNLTAEKRVEWALDNLGSHQVLTSSFGVQGAVCLHMYTQVQKDIPVVLLDTGYLFKETYLFIEELTKRLNLNLKIYSSLKSSAWQEVMFGKLWEQGIEQLNKYNRINKVEPMARALKEMNVKVWHSGLRSSQSESRKKLSFLSVHGGIFKFLPILDWNELDVDEYLKNYDLPYHPLFEKGYVSIGDYHSSMPIEEGMRNEDTRFFGLKRECGIHDRN